MINNIKKATAVILSLCTALMLTGCPSAPGSEAEVSGQELAEVSDSPHTDIIPVATVPAVIESPEPSTDEARVSSAPENVSDVEETEATEPPTDTPAPDVPAVSENPQPPGNDADFLSLSGLKDEIDYLIRTSEQDCVWDIWVECLPDGESIRCSNAPEATPMVAASLIKLFVMAAVYEQIDLGNISESEVEAKLESMITVSDNTACNDLTCLLGAGSAETGMEAVTAYAEKIGCLDTKMNRLMLVDNGLQNYTSAADCASILRMIYKGECVSEEYSKKMLELLKAQQRTGKIPAGVPDSVITANKTGELIGLSECDVAIVFAENADYILCALSQPADNSAAIKRIIKISEITYNYMAEAW